MSTTIPQLNDISEIYDSEIVDGQRRRWDSLQSSFKELYGVECDLIARSPGRVNVIGEHVDYSNFACLPMAISSDVLLAVKTIPDPTVHLANVHPKKFPSREFAIREDGDLEIDASKVEWSNYFKAGFRGAKQMITKKHSSKPLTGMKVLFGRVSKLMKDFDGWLRSCWWRSQQLGCLCLHKWFGHLGSQWRGKY